MFSEGSKPSKNSPGLRAPSRNGLATFIGFLSAGIIPLMAYILPVLPDHRFELAAWLAAITLFAVGAGRALFTERRWLQAGTEMLLIGSAAGLIAYGVGALGAQITNG